MELVIDRFINKKNILDDRMSILKNYQKLIDNPKTKYRLVSNDLKIKLSITIGYLIIVVLTLIFIRNFILYICLGISIMLFIYNYRNMESFNKFLDIQSKSKTDTLIEFTERRIQVTDRITNRIYIVEWSNIKQILVTKNCICFMPIYRETNDMNTFIVPRDYEIPLVEILNKLGKEKLMIFN